MHSVIHLAFAFYLSLTAVSLAAEPLIDKHGQLIGALGVQVGDDYYDVEFIDGSCAAVFDGCDEVSDLPFGASEKKARDASNELLRQVLQDGPLGAFKSTPSLIRGLEDEKYGFLYTPRGLNSPSPHANVEATAVVNASPAGEAEGWSDTVNGAWYINKDTDFSTDPTITFVRWTKR